MTGKAIGHASDQTIEAAHAEMNKLMTRSNYRIADITSEIHGEKNHQAVLHYNAYAV